jgi:Flp pilus assembly protein TadG
MRSHHNRSFLKAESGIAAIEFAFIMPFLLLLFFGLVDITDAVSSNRRITSVANSIGDLAAQNRKKILKTDIDDYFKAAALIMKPKSDSNVRVTLFGFRSDGTKGVLQWTVTNNKGPVCASAPSVNTMQTLMTAGNDIIVAQACMVYSPLVTSFLGETIMGTTSMKIEQIITMRPRASATLDCYQDSAATTAGCTS